MLARHSYNIELLTSHLPATAGLKWEAAFIVHVVDQCTGAAAKFPLRTIAQSSDRCVKRVLSKLILP